MSDEKKGAPTTTNGASNQEHAGSKLKTNPMGEATCQRRVPEFDTPRIEGAHQTQGTLHTTLPAEPKLRTPKVEGITTEIKWNHFYAGSEKYQYEVCWWSDETDRRSDFTNSKNYFLTKLKEGTTYYTKVTWISESSLGASRASETVRFNTGPAAPVELQVRNFPSSPHDSILVCFKDINKGRAVTHEVTVEAVSDVDEAINKPTAKRKILVKGLKPGTTYSVSVKTREGDKESSSAYHDPPITTYPAVPQNAELVYEHEKLKFTWQRPDIVPLHYDIHWEANGTVAVSQTEEERFVLDDVKLSTMYRFKVAAVNEAGRGYFSEEQFYQTDPAPPQNVSVRRNALSPSSSFIVNYEDLDTLPKSYEIFAASTDGEIVSHVESHTLSAVLNGLPEGRPHYVFVVAVYGDQRSKRAYCTKNMVV